MENFIKGKKDSCENIIFHNDKRPVFEPLNMAETITEDTEIIFTVHPKYSSMGEIYFAIEYKERLIRCKNCKYFRVLESSDEHFPDLYYCTGEINDYLPENGPNFFCGMGKMKDDEN